MVRRPGGVALREVGRLFRAGSLAGLGEAELLERFAVDGDEAAFEAIVRRLGPMVLGVCRRTLGDRHAADDAFQATFLVLARRAGAIRDGGRLGPWLFGVARRVARRAREQERRRRARERPEVDDLPGPDPGPGAERSEILEALDDEIARLPEAQRRPIVLCYLAGLTIDQAADRLGIPVGTARSRLARGRDRLRSRLARRGFEGRSALFGPMLAAGAARPIPSLPLVKGAVALATGPASSPLAAGLASATAPAVVLAQGALRTMMITNFATLAAGIVPVLAVGGSIGLSGTFAPGGDAPGGNEPTPAAVVAARDADQDDGDRPSEGDRPREQRREVRVLLREAPDGDGDSDGDSDLIPSQVRYFRMQREGEIEERIARLEAELARLKAVERALSSAEPEIDAARLKAVERALSSAEPEIDAARRSRFEVIEREELAAGRREELAAGRREEAARRAGEARDELEVRALDPERLGERAERLRGVAEAAEQARRRVRVEVRRAEQATRGVEPRPEGEADTATTPGDGDRESRRIILRRPDAPPAPPAPAPPEVTRPARAPSLTLRPAGPAPETLGDLDRRLSRIEERLRGLDALEQKLDRLVEALGDRP